MRTMLMYYFDDTFDEVFGTRLFLIEGDITDADQVNALSNVPFSVLINCAASVKHFAADDSLKRINTEGVKHLINLDVYKRQLKNTADFDCEPQSSSDF